MDDTDDDRRERGDLPDQVGFDTTIAFVGEQGTDVVGGLQPSLHRVHAKYRHLRELKRQRDVEAAGRAVVEGLYEAESPG